MKFESFENERQKIIYFIPENDYPFIEYDNFIKSFNINNLLEEKLIYEGLITKNKNVSSIDTFLMSAFFIQKNNIEACNYFNMYAVYGYNLIENATLKRKWDNIAKIYDNHSKFMHEHHDSAEFWSKIIKRNLNDFVPEATIVDKQIIGENYTDMFLQINGKLAVGYIGPYPLDNEDVRQTEKWMKVYKAECGYIFGFTITEAIGFVPQNIKIIKLDGSKYKFVEWSNK
jgi:hypothetical protein